MDVSKSSKAPSAACTAPLPAGSVYELLTFGKRRGEAPRPVDTSGSEPE